MSSEELVKRVVEEFIKSDGTLSELDEITRKHLEEYNQEVKREVEEKVIEAVGGLYFINTDPQILITPIELSTMLYNNLKDTTKRVKQIVKEHIQAKKTIKELSLKLYEGYGFNDKEVLDIKKSLPKYIQDMLKSKKVTKQVEKQIEKLKTKGLKASYRKLAKLIEEEAEKELQKALYTAIEEKARYYASRIARTEIARAQNLAKMKEFFEDESVEFVKYEMNPSHPKQDICDFYANLDIGYGRGVYPKKEARAVPLHPHCGCSYSAVYKKIEGKKRSIEEAGREYLSRLSDREKREILGTYELVERFKAGKKIEDIFNAIRPKYKIREYGDILKNINFNIDVVNDLKKMLKELKQKKKLSKNKIIVGELDFDIVSFLKERGVPIHTNEIYLTHKGLSHLARNSKAKRGAGLIESDIYKIPAILALPKAVFFDSKKQKLNLIYSDKSDSVSKIIKIVVDTKAFDKKLGKITLIKTAGYIEESNLKEYILILRKMGGR